MSEGHTLIFTFQLSIFNLIVFLGRRIAPASQRERLQHSHQVQAGLQGLGAGLPLGGADLIAVLVDELAGL